MKLKTADRAEIAQRLLRDIEATLGRGYEDLVLSNADNLASLIDKTDWYRDGLVEDVQQHFHDAYVDTTWPTCPRHLRHPLWLHGKNWCCEHDGTAVAPLGELASRLKSGDHG